MLGNTFGRVFRVTACGESYGGALLTIVDGVPAGLTIPREAVQEELDKRRPGRTPLDSPRKETDQVELVAGFNQDGTTSGAPVGLLIRNVDRQAVHIDQYRQARHLIRPGHAEDTFEVKYGPHRDWCGAGRASGRETAGRVAAGAVAKIVLAGEGIEVLAYTVRAGEVEARPIDWETARAHYRANDINCPDLDAGPRMEKHILEVKDTGDTVGGIVEVRAHGVPVGLGQPVFDKLSADLAKGLCSIGAVKGVEFGAGFAVGAMKGSDYNDLPYYDGKGRRIRFRTNRAGGIHGGISCGEELVMRIAVKPTPTLSIEQPSVDLVKRRDAKLSAITRRDATLLSRIYPVAEAMVRLVICDHLLMWKGERGMQRFENPWRPEG